MENRIPEKLRGIKAWKVVRSEGGGLAEDGAEGGVGTGESRPLRACGLWARPLRPIPASAPLSPVLPPPSRRGWRRPESESQALLVSDQPQGHRRGAVGSRPFRAGAAAPGSPPHLSPGAPATWVLGPALKGRKTPLGGPASPARRPAPPAAHLGALDPPTSLLRGRAVRAAAPTPLLWTPRGPPVPSWGFTVLPSLGHPFYHLADSAFFQSC